MNRQTFIDRIKVLFSEVESEDIKLAEDKPCECEGKDCECSDEYVKPEMAEEEVEVEAPEKKECECEEGDEDCKCDEEKAEEVVEPEMAEEVVEEEVKEEEPKEDEMEKRLEALEKALANISESMSAIDNLSEVVSKLANSPAEEEVKLSKASGKSVKKELTSREAKLKAFAKR